MPRECREVDRELKANYGTLFVRRQVREIYCKTEQDFASGNEWDEYLLLREDIIYKLVNGSKEEVHDTWRQIERYKAQNAESIRQTQRMRPKKVLEKVAAVIKSEGNFASRVNADWLDRMVLAPNHPFQAARDITWEEHYVRGDLGGPAEVLRPGHSCGPCIASHTSATDGGMLLGSAVVVASCQAKKRRTSDCTDGFMPRTVVDFAVFPCVARRYWKYTMWCQNESQATQFQMTANEQKKEMLTADIAKAAAAITSAALHLADIAQYESTDEADLKAATLLREKEAADFKALELELVEGIRTTQAAQTKLEQDIVTAGGNVAKKGAFLQTPPRPSKAMEAFSDVMVELTNAAALSAVEDMKQYPSLLEQAEAKQVALAQRRVDSQLELGTEPKKVVANHASHLGANDPQGDESTTFTPRMLATKKRPSIKSAGQGKKEVHEVHENTAEHLEWLNMSLKHLWPELSEAASAVAYSKILPILRQKLLAKGKGKITDVNFSSFSLGSVPVILGPVQVSRMPRGSVRIRMRLDYASDMKVEVSLDSTLGKWTFGMKDFRILGQLVLRIRPHIPDAPGTGGVSIFFVDPPKVDFKFSGDMQIGNFPFIKEIMRQLVDALVADMFVLPNVATQHMSLHDMKMYPLVIASPVPVGILRVTLKEATLDEKAITLPEDQQQKRKKKAGGVFSRLLGLGGKAFQAVSNGWENAEEWVERQVGQAMGIETAPYMRWKIGNQVWLPDFRVTGEETDTFNFVIYDPEQHLNVTLWDRDLLSQDDLMGEAHPVAAVKAVHLSEDYVPLICPGAEEETRQAGTFKAKIELLITSPGQRSRDGFVCVVRVRELLQDGSRMKGRRIALRAKLKDDSSITKAGAPMLDITETLPAKAMLQKIKDNMTDAGVEADKIEQVLDLTSLRACRFAINRSLHFVVTNDDTEKEDLILELVDMDKLDELKKEAAKKKGVFGGSTSPSPASNVAASDEGEEVLASLTVPLSEVLAAEGLALQGPFRFETEKLGTIEAKMFVGLSGLEPTTTDIIEEMTVDDAMADMELDAQHARAKDAVERTLFRSSADGSDSQIFEGQGPSDETFWSIRLQENLQLLRDVEAKSQSSLDAARAKEKRHSGDFLKLKNALEGKIRAVKQDLEKTKKELADAKAAKAKAEGELAVAEQDIKTGKEYLVQVERGCMEKAAQFQQQKKNRQDEIKAVQAALKALRGIMDTSAAKQGLFSFLQLASSSSRSKASGQTVATLAMKRVQQLAASLKSNALGKLASKMRVVSRYGGGGDVFGKMRKLIQEVFGQCKDSVNNFRMFSPSVTSASSICLGGSDCGCCTGWRHRQLTGSSKHDIPWTGILQTRPAKLCHSLAFVATVYRLRRLARMARPRLTYLDAKMLAEPIRLALFVGQVDFEDRRVTHQEVQELNLQGQLPFGQVPVLELDGQVFAQTGALLRWAGRQAKLYPEEPLLQLRCDAVEEALADMKKVLGPAWYNSVLGRNPVTKEQLVMLPESMREEVMHALNNTVLPARFQQLEKFLTTSEGPYFCGDRMTICDLSVYVYASGLLDGTYVTGIDPSVMDNCPGLKALVERVGNHPRVREWNESHP
ncbi:Esyt3 [Symbiodinium natans]|uniref:Esyt3 protein n=1 Tax=Symbiodinium natans TaxID=878477 RepID=A0A812NUU8_9DINO|nr:Esyt3 [Symbiodinium natans]